MNETKTDTMTVGGMVLDPQKIRVIKNGLIAVFETPDTYSVFVLHSYLSGWVSRFHKQTVAILFFQSNLRPHLMYHSIEIDSFGTGLRQTFYGKNDSELISQYLDIPGIYAPILDLAVEHGLILPNP